VTEVNKRAFLRIYGIVQGVGFRPTIYQIATKQGLRGNVKNCVDCVEINVEGPESSVIEFIETLPSKIPPLSRIDRIEKELLLPEGYSDFVIVESESPKEAFDITIPADLAMCNDCQEEINNPSNRRYQYPFTTCTNCGPRFTVIQGFPYDRETTTLVDFPLCDDCLKEYKDPLNRRYHAESMACPICGPKLKLETIDSVVATENVISLSQEKLRSGSIIAIRGLGGYLIACDANNKEAIQKLRERKNRPAKPFAVMAKDLSTVERDFFVSENEKSLLVSEKSPIVLLRPRDSCTLPHKELSPNANTIGIMLATTPMHELLLKNEFNYLLMTSGNLHGNPICRTNNEAKGELKGFVDYFLTHNREIERVCDDSVCHEILGKTQTLRRARGFAPDKVFLKKPTDKTYLALGADLKNTVCMAYSNSATLSPHNGDLEKVKTLEHFQKISRDLPEFLGKDPDTIIVDKHPGYYSSEFGRQLAKEKNLELIEIQHHHAHATAVMGEHDLEEALAIVFDGTGFGEDGTIWGGEILHVTPNGYQRMARLRPAPLPGGDQATLHPQRQLIARLMDCGLSVDQALCGQMDFPLEQAQVLSKMIEQSLNSPLSSAAGRLFDAVSALLGIAPEKVSYEGQAAIGLESAALQSELRSYHAYPLIICENDELLEVDYRPMLVSLLDETNNNRSIADMALLFHYSLAKICDDLLSRLISKTKCTNVVVSGGVFQNRLLTRLLSEQDNVRANSYYWPRQIPANDGGISFGQIMAAYNRHK
jgi:hydrogenase maturation protein HypF